MSKSPWREGVATNPAFSRDLPNWWAWIPCWLAIAAGGTLAADTSDRFALLGYGLAFLAGVAWQLANRRDLADRLRLLSILVGLAVVGAAVTVAVDVLFTPVDADVDTASLGALACAVAGPVLAEQWLRRKDRLRGLSDR